MTSKEALQLVINAINGYKPSIVMVNKHYGEIVLQLLNDLEILEILEKWIVVEENGDDLFPFTIKVKSGYISNRSSLILTEEEFSALKEWKERRIKND